MNDVSFDGIYLHASGATQPPVEGQNTAPLGQPPGSSAPQLHAIAQPPSTQADAVQSPLQ